MFFPFAAARCVKKPKQMSNIRGIPRIWKNGARTLGAKFEEFLENGGSRTDLTKMLNSFGFHPS
jgi:hypothetical protein